MILAAVLGGEGARRPIDQHLASLASHFATACHLMVDRLGRDKKLVQRAQNIILGRLSRKSGLKGAHGETLDFLLVAAGVPRERGVEGGHLVLGRASRVRLGLAHRRLYHVFLIWGALRLLLLRRRLLRQHAFIETNIVF